MFLWSRVWIQLWLEKEERNCKRSANYQWWKRISKEKFEMDCSHTVQTFQKYSYIIMSKMALSCRIFGSFGNPTLSYKSFFSTHPSPTLTTWSHKSRPLSWLPPLYISGSAKPRLAYSLMSTPKHHLVPKCIYVYYRYLESRKVKLLSDSW